LRQHSVLRLDDFGHGSGVTAGQVQHPVMPRRIRGTRHRLLEIPDL
jgi:hypothetical protein